MNVIELVRDELLVVSRPRMSRMLRMTAVVAIVLVFSMAKRVPEAAVSAYIIFFIAQRDVAATVTAGLGAVLGVTVAIALSLLCYSLAIGEPALRLPLMVALAFAAMYLMRSTPAGVLGLLVGFIAFYTLTFADFAPSPELLVRGVLWAWVFIVYPVGVLVLVDLAFGTKPVEVYRTGIAERLAAAAAVLGAGPDGDAEARRRLERYVRLGAGDLVPYVERGGPASAAPLRATLLRQSELLCLLLRELPDGVRRSEAAQPALRRAGLACESARTTLLGRGGAPVIGLELLATERRRIRALPPAARAVVLPLANCVQTVVLAVHELARAPAAERSPLLHRPKPTPPAQAQEGVRFALKVTLAATTAYLIYTALDWYSIHTATITCFFVAGASIGATIHKLTLRIAGAVIGATLGMLAIVLVLPAIDTIGGLTVLVAAVTLAAAWVATGSERISYAGFQIALAFYLTVLQGFEGTSKLYIGRDRVIGILLGNILISVVFTSLWPVRAQPAQRRALSRAAEALAAMLRAAPDDRAALDRAEADFDGQVTAAHEYAVLVWFERARTQRRLLLTLTQGLLIPIHAIAHTHVPAAASPAARAALASTSASASDWLGAFAAAIASSTPAPPVPAWAPAVAHEDVRQQLEWLELLHAQCVELAQAVPT